MAHYKNYISNSNISTNNNNNIFGFSLTIMTSEHYYRVQFEISCTLTASDHYSRAELEIS